MVNSSARNLLIFSLEVLGRYIIMSKNVSERNSSTSLDTVPIFYEVPPSKVEKRRDKSDSVAYE